MAKTEKTFPIRMDNETYRRLEAQAMRFGTSVTAYIRQACVNRLEKDEASMQSAKDHRRNERNGVKVEITEERTERHETGSDGLTRSPASAVRSWFGILTASRRKE